MAKYSGLNKKQSEAQKRRWAKIRAAKAHRESPPVRQQMKRFRTKKSVTISGEFLQSAITEASKQIADNLKRALHKELIQDKPFAWTTAGGQQICVDEMSEEHLRNTISFLQRKLVSAFGRAVWLSDTLPNLEALVAMMKEAKRRNLRF